MQVNKSTWVVRWLSVALTAFGSGAVGALIGHYLGGGLGVVLATPRLNEVVDGLVSEGAPPLMADLLNLFRNWSPAGAMGEAAIAMFSGFLAGSGMGELIGAVVGLLVGATSELGYFTERVTFKRLAVLSNSQLDHFLQGRISRWANNLVRRHLVGAGLGATLAEAIWLNSRSLISEGGSGYLPFAAFNAADAGLLGATLGLLIATLSLLVLAMAPWAFIGAIAGPVWGRIGDASSGIDPIAAAFLGASAAHALSLLIGPLRGKWSVGREGAIASLVFLWVGCGSPGAALLSVAGFLVLGWVIPSWGLTLTINNPALDRIGPQFPSLFFGWRASAGALLGIVVGPTLGYMGGLLFWTLLGSSFMHRKQLLTRWKWAGERSRDQLHGMLER